MMRSRSSTEKRWVISIITASIAAIATITTAIISNHHEQPIAVEAVGVVHTTSTDMAAWVYGVPVSDPDRDHIGELADGQPVAIVCTVQGPFVVGTNVSSTLWDKIRFNTGYGFIPDANVDTGSNAPAAAGC